MNEFGKRKPVLPDEPPAQRQKRSGHIALLLMGTAAVGGGAYALMPRQSCDPNRPALAAEQPADCRPGSSSSGGGHGGSGGSWSRSNGSAQSVVSADAGHTARGGFGSFMAHFSGGG